MNSNIKQTIDRIADQARSRYDELLKGARQTTEQAAKQVSKGKAPLQVVTRLGLELTAVGHKTADKVLKQNKNFLANRMDALADRLQCAASAEGIQDLVTTQLRLFPKNVSQIAEDARDVIDIFAQSGGNVRELVEGTISELRVGAPVRKAAKKPAARKTPARAKATTKKSKPAVARKKAKKAPKPAATKQAKAA